jgi:hypothetical protein
VSWLERKNGLCDDGSCKERSLRVKVYGNCVNDLVRENT